MHGIHLMDVYRAKLELLGSVVALYRAIRQSGKNSNDGAVPPIDILVGLRLSIAAIHAHKDYPAIIRNRYCSKVVQHFF